MIVPLHSSVDNKNETLSQKEKKGKDKKRKRKRCTIIIPNLQLKKTEAQPMWKNSVGGH